MLRGYIRLPSVNNSFIWFSFLTDVTLGTCNASSCWEHDQKRARCSLNMAFSHCQYCGGGVCFFRGNSLLLLEHRSLLFTNQWRRHGGKGEKLPPMGRRPKLCNMCVLSLSWNFFVSRQIHCKAVEQRATLIHRQYKRDWGTSYSRPPIDPYLTSPLLQYPGGATDINRPFGDQRKNTNRLIISVTDAPS